MNQLQNIQAAGHMEIIWGFTALHLKVISLRTQGLRSHRTLLNAWLLRHHLEVMHARKGIQKSSVFHLWGITKLSWLKVYLMLVKNPPLSFFPGRKWGLGMWTPSVFSKLFFLVLLETETPTGEWLGPLDPTPDNRICNADEHSLTHRGDVSWATASLLPQSWKWDTNDTWIEDFLTTAVPTPHFLPGTSLTAQITPYLAPSMPTAA